MRYREVYLFRLVPALHLPLLPKGTYQEMLREGERGDKMPEERLRDGRSVYTSKAGVGWEGAVEFGELAE